MRNIIIGLIAGLITRGILEYFGMDPWLNGWISCGVFFAVTDKYTPWIH